MREVRDERIARQRCDAVIAVHGGVDAVGSKADDGACDEDGHDDDEDAQPERHFLFAARDADTDFAYSAGTAGDKHPVRRAAGTAPAAAGYCSLYSHTAGYRTAGRLAACCTDRADTAAAGDNSRYAERLRLWRNVHVRDGLGFRRLLGIRGAALPWGHRKRSVPG